MAFEAMFRRFLDDRRKYPIEYEEGCVQMYVYEWSIHKLSFVMPTAKFHGPILSIGYSDEGRLYLWLERIDETRFNLGIDIESKQDLAEEFEDIQVNLFLLDKEGKVIRNFMVLKVDGPSLENKHLESKREARFMDYASDDLLFIRGEVSVSALTIPTTRVHSLDYGNLRKFSMDMQKLFEDGQDYSDIIIKVGDREFRAHKMVLCCRCPYLKTKLGETHEVDSCSPQSLPPDNETRNEPPLAQVKFNKTSGFCDILTIEGVSADAVQMILHYLYFARLLILNTTTCFELYALAQQFDLKNLTSFLKPMEIHSHTDVKVAVVSSCLIMKDFSTLPKGIQKGPIMTTTMDETILWQIIATPRPKDQKVYLNLHRVSGTRLGVQTLFDLYIEKPDGSKHSSKLFRNFFPPGSECCFPVLEDEMSLFYIDASVVRDDSLKVCCDLVASPANPAHPVFRTILPNDISLDLELLSKNFASLLDDDSFSDLVARAGERAFPVHKAILSARSPVFKRMLKPTVLVQIDMAIQNSLIMSHFLKYLYSGKMDNIDLESAEILYEASQAYQLTELKEQCSRGILVRASCMTLERILRFAEKHGDAELDKNARDRVIIPIADLSDTED